ncbi:MAG TPA: signal peptide peptidase SppA [Aggregatilineales bacterium]|nr:signal peptide peptidase SppA [Aggregatilineales bacterium]
MNDIYTENQNSRRGMSISSPVWIILAMMVGFLLPVCACMALTFAGVIGLGSLSSLIDESADTGSGEGIGVIELSGLIIQGEGIGAASENFIRDLEWMDDNDDVKAIVIRANSPGGDANASDVIWHALEKIEKPVYVAVDGMCASGCYYVAMAADANEIYATPNSLIGSIGVISMFINIEDLSDELGVEAQIIATGANKDFGSPFRELTEDEVVYWREQINNTFEIFINRVTTGRPNLSEGQVRELANGRVWASSIAQQRGLIDGIMYVDEVYDYAADQVNLDDDYRLIESPYEPTFLDFLFSDSPGFSAKVEFPDASDISAMLQQPPIQYRYLGPYGGALPE